MLAIRRLGAVGAILALAAIIACAQVWGEPGRDKDSKDLRPGISPVNTGPAGLRSVEELMASKFDGQPVARYDTREGETCIGVQLKPKLEAGPVVPRDYLLLIDTSASKAQGPLAAAIKLTEALVKAASAEDRFAIWTVNLQPKDLTRGFKSKDQLA